MQNLLPFFPLILVLAVIPLSIWTAKVARRQTAENLQRLAAQLGLDFQPAAGWTGTPRVTGVLRGKPLEVYSFTTGSGKSRRRWAALSIRPAGAGGLTFTLRRQGLGTKISEFFGTREIRVGDPAFDAAWFVQANQPEFFGAALIPELRAKLMAVQRGEAGGKFELKDGLVKYVEPGTLADAKRTLRFATIADVAGDLADIAEVAEALAKRT